MDPSSQSPPSLVSRLWVQVLVAMVLGTVLGLTLGETASTWLGWMGTVFIRLLRMVIVPLVVTSIVSGVASVGSGRDLGRLGAKTLAYYMGSSLLAILLGLVLVNAVRPGDYFDRGQLGQETLRELQTPGSLAEVFLRIIPQNPVSAAADGDMLGIIFFSILLGIAMTRVARSGDLTLQTLFNSAFQAMMVLTSGVIRLLPLGVLGLITGTVAASGLEAFKALAVYMTTVAVGLTFHLLVTLPLLLRFVGGISPRIHFRNMAETMLTAFSTSSSSATLPVTLQAVEKKVGVSNTVSSFVLPMGATINMDGTALLECVAVIFISQVLGYDLGVPAQILVVFTALLASIGAAGIPSAGLVMIFIITDAINLRGPEVSAIIGTLMAIDRPLDMYRTVVNVFSDSCGAAIIARSEGETGVDAA